MRKGLWLIGCITSCYTGLFSEMVSALLGETRSPSSQSEDALNITALLYITLTYVFSHFHRGPGHHWLVGQITWAVIDEGQGQHMSDMTRSQFELSAKSLLVSEALWALVNTFIRLSALILLHKVFGATAVNRYQSVLLIGLSILHGVATLLTAILICRPIRASWDSNLRGGTCGNQTAAYVVLEACGLLVDIAIIALPFRPVLTTHLLMKRKINILLVLSSGVVVIVITGLRIAALHRVNSSDFSYDQGYLGLLSTLGALLGIISCCAPSFAQFYRQLKASTGQRPIFRLLRSSFKSGLRETIDQMYYRAASRNSGIGRSRRTAPQVLTVQIPAPDLEFPFPKSRESEDNSTVQDYQSYRT
ncbi:hypothetical protein M434DRAFT_31634 [Hypoxylon sp. CO27-5]|nr:hypothetical protein M434DRAFT_31634 [Hypoxylon sp. CO27-5]